MDTRGKSERLAVTYEPAQRGDFVKAMKRVLWTASLVLTLSLGVIDAQQSTPSSAPVNPKFMADVMASIPPQPQTYPLYGSDEIPNSKPSPDEEKTGGWGSVEKVSRPTIQAFLPAKSKENGASVLVIPG